MDLLLSSFQAVVLKNAPVRTGTVKYGSDILMRDVLHHFEFSLCDKFSFFVRNIDSLNFGNL